MSQEKLKRFLQSTGIISPLQAADITSAFSPRTFGKNDFLLQTGKVNDEYLFLDEGMLRSFAYDVNGNDVTTGFYSSGRVVIEVTSFFLRTPSQENIQALTDGLGWSIGYQQLNTLFHAREEFREFGRSVLVQGFAALKSRMLSVITESAAARYDQLLRTTPEILQHAPLKCVASYLGITDTSLSRIRNGRALN